MRSWKHTITAHGKCRVMPDPRYARGPGPGYRAPKPMPDPPARADQRRRRIAQARANLAAHGFTPPAPCECGHRASGHRTRFDGQLGRCTACECERYQERHAMAHTTPPGMDTSTPVGMSSNRRPS